MQCQSTPSCADLANIFTSIHMFPLSCLHWQFSTLKASVFLCKEVCYWIQYAIFLVQKNQIGKNISIIIVCAEAEFFSYPWKSARLFNCDLGTTAQYRVSFLDQAEPICCAFIEQMPGIHRLSFQKKRTYKLGIVHLICPAWVVTWINV